MTTSSTGPVDDLVYANRILFDQGVVDGFGHVSVRCDDDDASFLLARSMAPALVGRGDILRFGLDGELVAAGSHPLYVERFIHAAIYRARQDVRTVVHSHSPCVIPFGVTRSVLRPIFHMCAFLGEGSAFFDTADSAGDTDLLVRDLALGERLAAALGERSMVLMRGHGSTVVGTKLKQAVCRAVYAETNARLQLQATALSTPTFLSAGEARLASLAFDTQLDRCWQLWVRAVGAID